MQVIDLLKNIQSGEFSIVLDNNGILKLKSIKEIEQIFTVCSQYIYNKEKIDSEQLILMINVIDRTFKHVDSNNFDIKTGSVLKSLFYIIIYGVKKGFSTEQVLFVSSRIDSLLIFDEKFCSTNKMILRKMYSTLWNLSLTNEIKTHLSIQLQTYALIFLLFCGESLATVCNNCIKVGKAAEINISSFEELTTMYTNILVTICNFLKNKPEITDNCVLSLNLVFIEFSKASLKMNNCKNLSKLFRPLAEHLEPICNPKIMMSFKMSVKIIEAGLAFKLGLCKEEVVCKMVKACDVILTTNAYANSIIVDSVLQALNFFENKTSGLISMFPISPGFFTTAINFLISKMCAENKLRQDAVIRVFDLFGNLINSCVNKMANQSAKNQKTSLEETLQWVKLIENCVSAENESLDKTETTIFNIGVGCCNLGVYAYKLEDYSLAAGFFNIGVSYLYHCSKVSDKTKSLDIIKKKVYVLKDSLRLGGHFKEAALKTVHLAFLGLIPCEEICTTWVKCKRDVRKIDMKQLEKITIKNIIDEVLFTKDVTLPNNFIIEDLLLEEIEGLKQLSIDTIKDELACSRDLIASENPIYRIEGYLGLCDILYSSTELNEDREERTAIDAAAKAIELLNAQTKDKEGIFLVFRARAHFWMYLCNLQVMQKQAEVELKKAEKESQKTPSTELGEEIQPNDVCDVRPFTSVSSFSLQEKSMNHLDYSLNLWIQVVKMLNITFPKYACATILSQGYIYKLCGMLYQAVQIFSFMLTISCKCNLEEFWMKAVVELIQLVPELISEDVVKRLSTMVIQEENDKKNQGGNYFKYEVFTTLAYFYYRNGNYKEGAKYLQQCLVDSFLDKKSPSAVELQIDIYYVLSLYASLPNSFMPDELKISDSCILLALKATRKAIGLFLAGVDNRTGVVCYDYKIVWLHHKTNMWYGRLCHITAQPRHARAYIRQALALSEKFALPLRTAECLCLLAEVDIQCDQLDDCRVKIDTLNRLLSIHENVNSKIYQKQNLIKNKTQNDKILAPQTATPYFIYEDKVDERLRESDFKLDSITDKLSSTDIVIGQPGRIHFLTNQNILPSSPSNYYREEDFIINKLDCPNGLVNCSTCSAPEIHCLAVTASSLMAMIHSQKDNGLSAVRCLKQAASFMETYEESALKIVAKLLLVLNDADNFDLRITNLDEAQFDLFVQSRLILTKLNHHWFYQEVLCSEDKFEKARLKSFNTIKEISKLSPNVLLQIHSLVVQLMLQADAIHKVIQNEKTIRESDEVSVISPVFLSPKIDTNNFKTPAKLLDQKRGRGRPAMGGLKPKQHVSSLSTTPLTQKKNSALTTLPLTPFPIFMDSTCGSVKNSCAKTTNKKTKLSRTRRKVEQKDEDNLEFSFNKLNLDDLSPPLEGTDGSNLVSSIKSPKILVSSKSPKLEASSTGKLVSSTARSPKLEDSSTRNLVSSTTRSPKLEISSTTRSPKLETSSTTRSPITKREASRTCKFDYLLVSSTYKSPIPKLEVTSSDKSSKLLLSSKTRSPIPKLEVSSTTKAPRTYKNVRKNKNDEIVNNDIYNLPDSENNNIISQSPRLFTSKSNNNSDTADAKSSKKNTRNKSSKTQQVDSEPTVKRRTRATCRM